jgi:hypothetical protein
MLTFIKPSATTASTATTTTTLTETTTISKNLTATNDNTFAAAMTAKKNYYCYFPLM